MQGKFPLMLSWDITIHKYQGRTLEMATIDLGNSEKCAGTKLVALSYVKRLENTLLRYFSHERLKEVNKANKFPIIKSAIQALHLNSEVTKT